MRGVAFYSLNASTLRFFSKSFYFFFNCIARYDGAIYCKDAPRHVSTSKNPQITCEAIFKNCLKQKCPFFYGGISYTVCNYYFQDVFTHGGGVGGVDSQCSCFAIVFGQYPFSV